MKRWSHIRVSTWDEVVEKGMDGWELIGTIEHQSVGTYMLKKPLPSIREEITNAQTTKALTKRG
ncbi:hypothetical protein [Peribacillus sp. NPDC097225]|uniref:hypothetical protein n=1 Tax=Peribacillus sp. NPDC097225 TaxID=3364400 RepID=UPI00381D94D8